MAKLFVGDENNVRRKNGLENVFRQKENCSFFSDEKVGQYLSNKQFNPIFVKRILYRQLTLDNSNRLRTIERVRAIHCFFRDIFGPTKQKIQIN